MRGEGITNITLESDVGLMNLEGNFGGDCWHVCDVYGRGKWRLDTRRLDRYKEWTRRRDGAE